MRYLVEVFPIAPDRWITVVDTDSGPFSTETTTPEGVEVEVVDSIREVLEIEEPHFDLVDDLGVPWVPRNGLAQMQRLGVEGYETHPARPTVGILFCADGAKDGVVRYALRSANVLMAVAAYTYDTLPRRASCAPGRRCDFRRVRRSR